MREELANLVELKVDGKKRSLEVGEHSESLYVAESELGRDVKWIKNRRQFRVAFRLARYDN
jgi:hypothetical protein